MLEIVCIEYINKQIWMNYVIPFRLISILILIYNNFFINFILKYSDSFINIKVKQINKFCRNNNNLTKSFLN